MAGSRGSWREYYGGKIMDLDLDFGFDDDDDGRHRSPPPCRRCQPKVKSNLSYYSTKREIQLPIYRRRAGATDLA